MQHRRPCGRCGLVLSTSCSYDVHARRKRYGLPCGAMAVMAPHTGMFGVGGGIVKGPLMLEMGVLPDVAAATSATMIM